jgi:glyoxylase-like metal-dependent hydrolase (beta-lactamase superfamily II)/rhodanese-related sulfurtransferase
MFVERFFVEGLAHASYVFGKDGEAAVVDPKRDVEDYLAAAERHGARIVAIFETHPHADFVSGHMDLAARTGVPIYVSTRYPAQFPHVDLEHTGKVTVGGMAVTGLDTPGHSPDSMSFCAEDGAERVVFSGDILFVGDVGRPDLRDMHADPRQMAEALYDTLHGIFWQLPDDTVVYPAHGAGSLCGRRLGSAPSSTIGAEKAANWANEFKTREAFVEAMVSNLPERPLFFYKSPFVNLAGPKLLAEVRKPEAVGLQAYRERFPDAVVLDTRTAEAYGAGHLAGSLNVGLQLPVFSTWVGSLLQPDQPLVLVVERPEEAEQAWLDLARIGYERVLAYLIADPKAWSGAGLEVRETPQLEVCCVDAWVKEGRNLLDVRTPGEWNAGGVDGSVWIPLSKLPERLDEAPQGPLAVMCGSGYRSSIAASLLERAGRSDVVNVRGGWGAYSHRQCAEPDSQDLFCQDLFDRMPAAS